VIKPYWEGADVAKLYTIILATDLCLSVSQSLCRCRSRQV